MTKRNIKSTLEQYAFGRTAITSCGRLSKLCVRDLSCRDVAYQLSWYGRLRRNSPGVGIFRFQYEMCLREKLLRKIRGTWKVTYKDHLELKRPYRNKKVTLKVSRDARPFSTS